MPGFNLSIGNTHFPSKEKESKLKTDRIKGDYYTVNKFTVNKFTNDKLFVETEYFLIVLEGVILNKKDLIRGHQSWGKAVIDIYRQKGDAFFGEFRGSFSGLLYDKREDKWIVFTDHIGSKHIYYTKSKKRLFISSEISDIYDLLKNSGLSYSLDEQGAYMLLSYGYMLEDHTLCKEIKKILPGCYLVFNNVSDTLDIKQYYQLPDEYDYTIDEDEAVEKVDSLFRNAIKLQFDKDLEYKCKHLVALSGGLDSRMTSWVAHNMGYKNQLNFTFSQTGYLDETIAKKIAEDLKHEWIFKALDNGLFLEDIDDINAISGGNILYYGIAHSNSAIRLLNFDKLGIIHSGQLGDVVVGTFIKKEQNKYNLKGMGAYSDKFIDRVSVSNNHLVTKEAENFLMKQRGFNGANTGLLPLQNNSETLSPFYNIDFFTYCLQIAINLRKHHKLYRKWVIKKYPGAAEYIWTKTKSRLTSKSIHIKGRELFIKKLPSQIFQKLRLAKPANETRKHMNPLGYWYRTNSEIRKFQDDYFKTNLDFLNQYGQLKKDSNYLYEKGNAVEKNQVLTLLSALKLFFK